MPLDLLNLGTAANDRTGDTWRAGGEKINAMFTDLFGLSIDRRIVINQLSDFPAAAAGVITLAPNTQYLIANDVNLGTDRLVMASNTSVSGIESIVVTLSYTGTGDMFTILNTRSRISQLSISCVSGRVVNLSDNTDTIFRMNDVSVACDRFGLFNSSGANGTTMRFTNVSPSSITTSGLTFLGGWNTLLWEISAANILAGIFFNLGTATFSAFISNTVLVNVSAGATFLSGATGSANINSGGIGQVISTLSSGAGTLLAGITTADARWEFLHNDDIKDTRPDALMSMQGNATVTTIAVSGTYVLVAGTWVDEGSSQFTFTSGGRLTYIGGKDARLPIDFSCSAEPVSGNAKTMAFQLALNGTVIPASKRTGSADAGKPAAVAIPWQVTFTTGDFVEIFVTNDTDAIDVLVSSAVGRVN
jgi:hypothetical protein